MITFLKKLRRLFGLIIRHPALFWMLGLCLVLFFVSVAKLFSYSDSFTEAITKVCNVVISSRDADAWDN
mgnify:CR=1 FL=1